MIDCAPLQRSGGEATPPENPVQRGGRRRLDFDSFNLHQAAGVNSV